MEGLHSKITYQTQDEIPIFSNIEQFFNRIRAWMTCPLIHFDPNGPLDLLVLLLKLLRNDW